MALFGIGKKDGGDVKPVSEQKEAPAKAVQTPVKARSGTADLSHILRNPRISEKATMHAGVSAYVFDVAERATKRNIAEAVSSVYNVRPRMVRVVTIRAKVRRNMRTGKSGMSRGGKKAYVYLKKGDTISIT